MLHIMSFSTAYREERSKRLWISKVPKCKERPPSSVRFNEALMKAAMLHPQMFEAQASFLELPLHATGDMNERRDQ